MKKSVFKTSPDKHNVKHLRSLDLTAHKLELLGGTKGEEVHLKKMHKDKNKKDFYT